MVSRYGFGEPRVDTDTERKLEEARSRQLVVLAEQAAKVNEVFDQIKDRVSDVLSDFSISMLNVQAPDIQVISGAWPNPRNDAWGKQWFSHPRVSEWSDGHITWAIQNVGGDKDQVPRVVLSYKQWKTLDQEVYIDHEGFPVRIDVYAPKASMRTAKGYNAYKDLLQVLLSETGIIGGELSTIQIDGPPQPIGGESESGAGMGQQGGPGSG